VIEQVSAMMIAQNSSLRYFHRRLLRDAFFRLAAFAIEGALSCRLNAIDVMAVTTRNHENAETMIASAFNVASLRSRPMQKYLWAIVVFLLQGLVICGVAWVFSALFGYPGGRFQGHGAGLFGALVAVLVLGYVKGVVTRGRAASVSSAAPHSSLRGD
jgi:hypothetical protein